MPKTPFHIDADIKLTDGLSHFCNSSDSSVRIRQGHVPQSLKNSTLKTSFYEIAPQQCLLTLPNGVRFLISHGDEITYFNPDNISDKSLSLFLSTTPLAVIAYQRGLLAIKSSSFVMDGHIITLVGQTGIGLSTLCYALSQKKYQFFSDDMLILNPLNQTNAFKCFAVQRRLKLWPNPSILQSTCELSPMRKTSSFNRVYAKPNILSDQESGQLGAIFHLKQEPSTHNKTPFKIEPVTGGRTIKLLADQLYAEPLGNEILGRKNTFCRLAETAKAITIYDFYRPQSEILFDQGVDYFINELVSMSQKSSFSSKPK